MSNVTKIFYVYCFQNKINNKMYIGKTSNIEKRKKEHALANGDCPLFHNAIKKYGIDNFNFLILSEHNTEKEALEFEIKYIKEYKTNVDKFGDKFGYNLTDGGDGVSGHKHLPETIDKISKSLKGRPGTNKGKIFSDDVKLKLSESHMGQIGYWKDKEFSEQHKKNLSDSHMGHPGFWLNKKRSPETIEKIRKSNSGKIKPKILSEDSIKEIIKLYNSNNYTYNQLAIKFNVGKTTIFRIVKNGNKNE